MRYVRDRTGRFSMRPHYEPAELDQECEKVLETPGLLARLKKTRWSSRPSDSRPEFFRLCGNRNGTSAARHRETFVEHGQRAHAVGAEMAEIVTQLAPRIDQRRLDVVGDRERPDRAR